MHVHVQSAHGEAKFWLEPSLILARSTGLSGAEIGTIEQIIKEHKARMKSQALGINTSNVEVTNISKHGFWILIDEEELFLPFEEFPWFRSAPLPAIMNVEQPAAGSLSWPLLDVDLAIESIRHPERYPLMSKCDT